MGRGPCVSHPNASGVGLQQSATLATLKNVGHIFLSTYLRTIYTLSSVASVAEHSTHCFAKHFPATLLALLPLHDRCRIKSLLLQLIVSPRHSRDHLSSSISLLTSKANEDRCYVSGEVGI